MKSLKLILIFTSVFAYSQSNIFDRLSVLDNNGKTWYNIDGYSVTSEVFNNSFDEKGLKKIFKKHNITETDLKIRDEKIDFNNYFITKKQNIAGNIFQTNNYYFVENPTNTTTVVWFVKNGITDRETEEELVNRIIKNQIPRENFVQLQIQSIDFVGRKIELGNSCYWSYLNTVQCPYFGEMNWSIHKTLEDAKQSIENQFNITKTRKNTKIASENIVDVEFEAVQPRFWQYLVRRSLFSTLIIQINNVRSTQYEDSICLNIPY